MIQNHKPRKAFTLVEILFSVLILAVLGTMLAQLILRSTRSFNSKLWRQTANREVDRAFIKLQKFLKLASYPALNTFKGVLRDRNDTYSMNVFEGNLSLAEAFSKNTKNLAKDESGAGDVNFDEGAATFVYFGSGIKDDWSADNFDSRYDNNTPETDILTWTSCQPGYQSIPGFQDAQPRCGKHRLFLKNRSRVQRAVEHTYQYFQDLFLESSFCFSKGIDPVGGDKGYLLGQGQYQCQGGDYVTERSATLQDDEKSLVGTKLLAHNIAAVTIYYYRKPNERSTTVGIDLVAVAPYYGTEVIKKGTQSNISLRVLQQ